MAILTGHEILNQINNKHIKIKSFNPHNLLPASYAVTLNNKIRYYTLVDNAIQIGQMTKNTNFETYGMPAIVDPTDTSECGFIRAIPYLDSNKNNRIVTQIIPDTGYILLPRIVYLIECEESIWSDNYLLEFTGLSRLSKLGITIKPSGYETAEKEIKNILEVEVTHPVKIYPNMCIAQCYFHTKK